MPNCMIYIHVEWFGSQTVLTSVDWHFCFHRARLITKENPKHSMQITFNLLYILKICTGRCKGVWDGRDLHCRTPATTRELDFAVLCEDPYLVTFYYKQGAMNPFNPDSNMMNDGKDTSCNHSDHLAFFRRTLGISVPSVRRKKTRWSEWSCNNSF